MTPTWEPGIGDHLRTIWHYKWFLIGAATIIAEAVFVLLSTFPPVYEAEASVRLSGRSESGLLFDEERVEYASRVYAELAESPSVLAEAVNNSGLPLQWREAADALEVDWARPPGFIDVTASADSGQDAVKLADGMAEAIIAVVAEDAPQSLDDQVDETRSSLVASLVEPAVEPLEPTSPRPLRDAIAVFIIALVVFAEAAALWRPARGLLPLSRTAERVSELVGIPTLTLTGDPEDRTRLALFSSRFLASKPAVLLVHCSGESLPAAPVRLAEAVTAGGRRTLVVDGEGTDPNMHRRLGLPQGPGLAEVMNGKQPLAEAVFESQAKSEISVLTAGGSGGKRQSLPAKDALDQLGAGYDFLIVNVGSTALLDGVASAVAEQRQSTILVFDPEKTKRRKLSELVHGFGGHEDVVAILLLTKAAAATETTRLADRWWRRRWPSGGKPQPQKPSGPSFDSRPIRAGDRT